MTLKKSFFSGIIFTFVAHSFCCGLPLIGVLVGVNGIGYFLHEYEVYIILLNIALIVFGYYVHYHHKKKSNCSHKHCTSKEKHYYWATTIVSVLLMILSQFLH
jgi:hypothetical protein